jgi:hypothetical protein
LESTKNKKDNKSKSGIYKITCGTRRCGFKYIGQSRRAIQTRFTEHLRAFKKQPLTSIRCSWAYVDERWEETRLQTQIWYPELRTYTSSQQPQKTWFLGIISNSSGRCRSPLFDVIFKNNLNQNIATVVFSIDITHWEWLRCSRNIFAENNPVHIRSLSITTSSSPS